MSRGLKLAIRIGALVLVVGSLFALSFNGVYGGKSSVNGGSGKDAFKVGDRLVRLRDIKAVPSTKPEPAAVALPKVGSVTELLSIFNKMGLIYDSNVTRDYDGSYQYVEAQNDSSAGMEMKGSAPLPSMAPAAADNAGESGYSETNSQVSGVAEGDIVKTDGKYIYAAYDQTLRIVEANGADMRVVSEISLDGSDDSWEYFSEMYVSGDYLITVTNRSETIGDIAYPEASNAVARCIWYPQRQFTVYSVYDMSDRENPVLTRSFEAEGYALATRMMGNNLYFVTNKHIYALPADDMGEGDILPMYRDSAVSDDVCVVSAEDISYIPGSVNGSYMIVGAFDITSLEEAKMETLLGAGGTVYMSGNALYVAREVYDSRSDADGADIAADIAVPAFNGYSTEIYRFSIDDTDVYYSGMGKTQGYPLNQYSMDEHNGYFRIATTDWEKGNRITIFDDNMKVYGHTEDLAKGEQIYSVRFMGDMGYMVTYEQVDPLFAVDLSDPANPTVLGQLKIPGFSQYLHPVGDGLLVGFGRHTAELYVKDNNGNEQVVGTQDMGMKISLFDVADPKDPKEIDVMLLGENSWTEAFNNPRAMMVDASRSLFGFAMEGGKSQANGTWVPEAAFTLVSVKGGKLFDEARLDMENEDYNFYNARMCYIGETLYGITSSGISAFDYSSYELLKEIGF